MAENGHLNGSWSGGGEIGYFWTLKMEFPGFPGFGLCRGWGGSQSKGKWGELPKRGKVFPLRDTFPLKIAFPVPRNGLFSHEMKDLRKRSFYGLREHL